MFCVFFVGSSGSEGRRFRGVEIANLRTIDGRGGRIRRLEAEERKETLDSPFSVGGKFERAFSELRDSMGGAALNRRFSLE